MIGFLLPQSAISYELWYITYPFVLECLGNLNWIFDVKSTSAYISVLVEPLLPTKQLIIIIRTIEAEIANLNHGLRFYSYHPV